MKENIVNPILKWSQTILLFVGIGACLTNGASAATDAGPCSTNTEIRQLDYWLVTWIMANAGGSSNTSKVYLSLDRCMFVEHWENGKGHVTGKMLAYSPEEKNWYGIFADNEGRVHVFLDGKVASGTAEFHGPSRGPNGE